MEIGQEGAEVAGEMKVRILPSGMQELKPSFQHLIFPRSLPFVFARAAIEIVCKRDSAVLPCLIWTGGADHHLVVGEVKL